MTAKLTIEYDGTDFYGWAIQPGARTVQGELERVLTTLSSGVAIPVTVAGRTDRGVHAWGQVASHPGRAFALRPLNGLLPADVVVRASEPAPDDFDARQDAIARTYCFRGLTGRVPSAFLRRTAVHWPHPLDRGALDACAAALVGPHDFTAFTPTQTVHQHFRRTVSSAAWATGDGGLLEFWITADAFLRNQIRILVGTMLQVGAGLRSVASFVALLGGAPRREAGPTAPPHGLALAGVTYGPGAG